MLMKTRSKVTILSKRRKERHLRIRKLSYLLLGVFIFLGTPTLCTFAGNFYHKINSIEMRELRYIGAQIQYPKIANKWNEFNESQLQSLVESYCLGEPHGYEYDLPAANIKESSAGVKLWHPKDPAAGRYGNSIYIAIRREYDLHYRAPLSKKHRERKIIKNRLMTEHPLDAFHAILTLLDGHKKFENDPINKIAYFNGGNENYGGDKAQKYALNFIDIKDFLSYNIEFHRLIAQYKGTIEYVNLMLAYKEFSTELTLTLKKFSIES